ncbi:sentrin-specific protease 2 [Brachionichthys hirsutus]|uniref:sentrin-specific protease 2 n=1 Tax=Brachionichthys hirsutus TaxID=412623 RepID=UPI003604CF64
MYGWIVDGISSLFEPVHGQNPTEWPRRDNVSEEVYPRPGVLAGEQNHNRPAKRNYQSVDVADGVSHSDPVEVKRRRRDVVLSFVKKTAVRVAGLLMRRKPLTTISERPGDYEETQPVTLMGIDELHTSWLNSTEWRMSKPMGGLNERVGKNPFQSASPTLMRKHSRAGLPGGIPDRGKDREKRGSLQLLPSRPTLRMGTSNVDTACHVFGHSRCYKPNLTVEEAIKQNNKEHYRRLFEMVREKYSKSQPLPFNQTKPQDEPSLHCGPKRASETVPRKIGYTASSSVFTWKHGPVVKDRRASLTFGKTFSGTFEDTQPARCAKQRPVTDLDLSTEVATRLSLEDRESPAVSLTGVQSTRTRYSNEDIPWLTKEMAAEVSCALSQSDPNLVLSAAFKLRITQRDLSTLREGSWLNDEIINFYLNLVMERSSGGAAALKVYSFSTFFFPKLRSGGGVQEGGHAAVRRWTKAVDLFLYDLILVPLHLGVHWAMAVIDFKSKTVKSYDSMGRRHDDICSVLLLYLQEEHKIKRGRELDGFRWAVGSTRVTEIPQQSNGSDCGVFACKYADYIAKGRPLTFKQCHMPLFRKLMIWEILNQKLL